jgi:hypothetical protein
MYINNPLVMIPDVGAAVVVVDVVVLVVDVVVLVVDVVVVVVGGQSVTDVIIERIPNSSVATV